MEDKEPSTESQGERGHWGAQVQDCREEIRGRGPGSRGRGPHRAGEEGDHPANRGAPEAQGRRVRAGDGRDSYGGQRFPSGRS